MDFTVELLGRPNLFGALEAGIPENRAVDSARLALFGKFQHQGRLAQLVGRCGRVALLGKEGGGGEQQPCDEGQFLHGSVFLGV